MTTEKQIIEFDAEIRQVTAKKLVSLDKEIIIIINTSDIKALELGKVESDKIAKIRVEVEE